MNKLLNFIIAGCLTIANLPAFAQIGALDHTFDFDGKAVTSLGNPAFSSGRGVAIQSDGKIVVAGTVNQSPNQTPSGDDFALVRYNMDGSLDASFGSGGKVITPVGTLGDIATSVAIQGNEKIVVAGYADNGGNNDFAVVRYNNDGTLDNTFGANGKAVFNISSADNYGMALAIQSDGKIVVAGYTTLNLQEHVTVLRCDTNGVLDAAFGTLSGAQNISVSTNNARGNSIAIQSNGKIVVAGYVTLNSYANFLVVRCNTNGSIDNTFGTSGVQASSFGNYDGFGRAVAIQSNGKIVVAGGLESAFYNDFALVRYSGAGQLDASFGTSGGTITSTGNIDGAYSVALQTDGKIVAGGFSVSADSSFFALHRYNTNGSLDTAFGSGGMTLTSFGTDNAFIESIAIASDGKIVAAGYAGNFNNTPYTADFTVARYNISVAQGIIGASTINGVNVFPNPATNGVFTIEIPQSLPESSLIIYDMVGKAVSQSTLTAGNNTISANLSTGIYLYKILDAKSETIHAARLVME